jgi:hypothetical protein
LARLVVVRRAFTVVIHYFVLVVVLHFLQLSHVVFLLFFLRNWVGQPFIFRVLRNKFWLLSHEWKFNSGPGQMFYFSFSLLVRLWLLRVARGK